MASVTDAEGKAALLAAGGHDRELKGPFLKR
jgi:hypothetical protein